LQAGRYAEGLAYADQHAQQVLEDVTLRSRRASLLARAGQTDRAVEEFRNTMVMATSGSNAAVGVIARDIAQAFGSDKAIALFRDEPVTADTARGNHRILIRFYRSAGRFEEAASLTDQLLLTAGSESERAQLLEERADIHNLAGRPREARQAYEEALEIDDGNWILLNNLAYLLSNDLGEHEVARPYAERAVAAAETTHTLDTLGWILVGLGEYRRAIAELNRAIRLAPDVPISYYHLGEAYRRAGQFADAANILENGKEIAHRAQDGELEAQIDASLQKTSERDGTP
jgi:tetratricopeptide (TPR) repeat protein